MNANAAATETLCRDIENLLRRHQNPGRCRPATIFGAPGLSICSGKALSAALRRAIRAAADAAGMAGEITHTNS